MLPSRYDKSQKKYPVLYMHDGQNLFDPLTGYKNQTWGILDTYEEHPELPEVIIVGIENGGDQRSNELVPFRFNFAELGFDAYGDQDYGGKTDDYLCFIINQVKPYIDKHYRTYKSAKNTAIMGSSFGGVCSMYAALEYGEYFSRFGCVSNAHYVVQKDIEDLARNSSVSHIKKFYMDVGTKESSNAIESQNYIDSNQAVFNIFLQKMEQKKLRFVLAEGAIHNEEAWRVRFADIVSFLFND
jgi:predicted alpha/beta superfamily hydrolase